MARKILQTKAGPMVQLSVYIPQSIHEDFEQKARKNFKTPAEAARDAFREYVNKKVTTEK